MKLKQSLSNASHEVVTTTRLKISHAKKDRRLVALLGLEFFFVLILVGSVLVYLNPSVNLPEPFSASVEARVFVFILIIAVILYLYSFTKDYRIKRTDEWLAVKNSEIKKKDSFD